MRCLLVRAKPELPYPVLCCTRLPLPEGRVNLTVVLSAYTIPGFAITFILKTAVNDSHKPDSERLLNKGLDLLAAGSPAEAAESFRAAIAADETNFEAHHGLVRALRDAGRLEQSVGAALALTALTPHDPLAHTALSISLQTAGHVPEAEAAAARARVAEWKILLKTPPAEEPRG